jgi:hypothetical protein
VKTIQHAFIGEDQIILNRKKKRGSALNMRRTRLVARIYHLGAGRQSSYLLERMLIGELPRADLVVFADTGDEPRWVYEQVKYLQARCEEQDIPLFIVRQSEGGLVHDIQHNFDQRFASLPLYTRGGDGSIGRMKRQCTSEYKIAPSENMVLNWLVQHGHAMVVIDKNGRTSRRVHADVYTENYYGISYEEYWRAGNRGPGWQKAIYPMIDERKTADDAVLWLGTNNRPVPKKSACRVCPFHNDEYWLWMKTEEPEDFEYVCQFDEWLRSQEAKNRKQLRGLRQDVNLHRSCQPLRSVDFAMLEKDRQAAPLLDLCGDYCMT